MNRGTRAVHRARTCMLKDTEYIFGQLFATIDIARMTKQNWPNFPKGGTSTAASKPPMPELAYPSEYAGVLIDAVLYPRSAK
jgi:hypothetical protein